MIRVIVADDHPVVRTGVSALLETQPDLVVVAEFATVEDLLEAQVEADVVVTDLRFGEGRLGGADAARVLGEGNGPPVLVLTTYDSDVDIVTAIEAGAVGYLLKDAPTRELASAVRDAAAGRPALGPAVQQRLMERAVAPHLQPSARELEVLRLIAEGNSNNQIAAALHVSLATVKSHVAHLLEKMHADSRTAAVAEARRRGILA